MFNNIKIDALAIVGIKFVLVGVAIVWLATYGNAPIANDIQVVASAFGF